MVIIETVKPMKVMIAVCFFLTSLSGFSQSSVLGNAVAYRKSWLKEAGASEYPKTWDDARKLFAGLKK